MQHSRLSHLARTLLVLFLIGLPLFGAPASASAATIVYVNAKAHGANNGTSWTDAYKSLSTALKKAPSGSQLWVAKGTYVPTTLSSPGFPRSATFTLRNKVALYGGFKGTETLLKQRKPLVNVTILSGDIGTAGDYTDDVYHVVTGGATNTSAVLDGFKIIAGYANGAGALGDGGGMYNNADSPTLRNLVFYTNYAQYGGGLFNNNASPIMTNILFYSNNADHTSGQGGALYNHAGNPSLTNATFFLNGAANGGAMVNDSMPGMSMSNVTFFGNDATSFAGGLYNTNGNTTITNATFNSNSAGAQGGAIYNSTGGQVTIVESILFADGSELQNGGGATAIVKDAILQGGCTSGTSCTAAYSVANPDLAMPADHGGFVPTQALGPASDAIDSGGANAACAPRDARGVKRPQGLACDLGAYEVNVANFRSIGLQDGQVTESTQTSSVGKGVNNTATTIKVGDTKLNQQTKGVLSFNTGPLPNTATLLYAQLFITQQSIGGFTPWTTHGNMNLDVTRPYFGSSAGLAANDFQAGALAPMTAVMNTLPVGNVYSSGFFSNAGLGAINRLGSTQIRLYWTNPDDNDFTADYSAIYSGDASSSLRPKLVIYYNP